jgi:hypothetical protein
MLSIPNMLTNLTLHCDTCSAVIPRGTRYRVGWTTTEDAAKLVDSDDRATVPTWTQEPDGSVRFEVCAGCTRRSVGLYRGTVDVVAV